MLPRSESLIVTPVPAPKVVAMASRRLPIDLGDRAWATGLGIFAGAICLIAGLIVFELAGLSRPLFHSTGWLDFLKGDNWDPVQEQFGAWPFIYGTLVTSAVALVAALPISLGLALFLNEMAPAGVRPVVSFAVELLAGVPSVVFGLWGVFILVPWLRQTAEPFLADHFGFLPLFRGPPTGLGFLAAGLVLAVMILPTLASVSLQVFRAVPQSLREAALVLGATRWEMVRLAVLPYSKAGVFGAVLLGLGRALGETMAVTMVIGNSPEVHASLLAPGYSLPAVIANEFAEATGSVHVGALAALALVLFGVTFLLNSLARLFIRKRFA